MADSPISRYQIIAREVGGAGIVTESATSTALLFNITGLLPVITYSFTVVAISEGGNVITVSQESQAIQRTTVFTGHLLKYTCHALRVHGGFLGLFF